MSPNQKSYRIPVCSVFLQEGYNAVYNHLPPKTRLLCRYCHEDLDLGTLQDLAQDIFKEIERHGCNRILNDIQQARLTKGPFETYNMPGLARHVGVGLSCKRALLVSDVSTDFHFLETVFLNQGHNVKLFTDSDKAPHWLLNKA